MGWLGGLCWGMFVVRRLGRGRGGLREGDVEGVMIAVLWQE